MKIIFLIICSMFMSMPESVTEVSPETTMEYSGQDVVFRTTQCLASKDGREIYLYPSKKCELFDGGRLIVACMYRIQNGEVRLLDENGDTVYKGSYRLANDRRNLLSLTIAGTTYYRK